MHVVAPLCLSLLVETTAVLLSPHSIFSHSVLSRGFSRKTNETWHSWEKFYCNFITLFCRFSCYFSSFQNTTYFWGAKVPPLYPQSSNHKLELHLWSRKIISFSSQNSLQCVRYLFKCGISLKEQAFNFSLITSNSYCRTLSQVLPSTILYIHPIADARRGHVEWIRRVCIVKSIVQGEVVEDQCYLIGYHIPNQIE